MNTEQKFHQDVIFSNALKQLRRTCGMKEKEDGEDHQRSFFGLRLSRVIIWEVFSLCSFLWGITAGYPKGANITQPGALLTALEGHREQG